MSVDSSQSSQFELQDTSFNSDSISACLARVVKKRYTNYILYYWKHLGIICYFREESRSQLDMLHGRVIVVVNGRGKAPLHRRGGLDFAISEEVRSPNRCWWTTTHHVIFTHIWIIYVKEVAGLKREYY